jgi:hypothetical protein
MHLSLQTAFPLESKSMVWQSSTIASSRYLMLRQRVVMITPP